MNSKVNEVLAKHRWVKKYLAGLVVATTTTTTTTTTTATTTTTTPSQLRSSCYCSFASLFSQLDRDKGNTFIYSRMGKQQLDMSSSSCSCSRIVFFTVTWLVDRAGSQPATGCRKSSAKCYKWKRSFLIERNEDTCSYLSQKGVVRTDFNSELLQV